MENNIYMATYGTLRKGYGNHRLISKSKFLGEGYTKENYSMYTNGSFPYVTKLETDTQIYVEVYSLTPIELQMCDYLEGNGSHYTREEIDIVLLDGSEIKSWLYFNDTPYGNKIPSGIFK